MVRQIKSSVILSAVLVVPCLIASSSPARPQAASGAKDVVQPNPDALAFLTEVLDLYRHATSYRLEYVEETTNTAEFSRSWQKSFTAAIVGPGNRFRFEVRGDRGRGLQISDGRTEWIYYPPFRQYTQKPVPTSGPSPVKGPVFSLSALNAAQRTLKGLSALQNLIGTATYAADETVDLNGSSVACRVIKTEGELPGSSPRITTAFVFWVDKQTHVIRKMVERREGPLIPDQPDANHVMQRTTLFPVADLVSTSFPGQTFAFEPASTASLVDKFEDRWEADLREFVGKQIPDIALKAADGKDTPLKSFQGRPILLDFWATWCGPCVASLPSLEKLHRETASDGLVLLSIDQDEDPAKAIEFWAKHNEPWPNFHGNADILRHFPPHGIPYFVLIDASGHVVFSAAGLDEAGIRSAVTKLGSPFASVSKAASP